MIEFKKLAVLIAPFKDRTDADIAALNEAKRKLLGLGYVPLFLPDTLCDVLDDHDEDERDQAIRGSAYVVGLLAEHPEAEAIVVGRLMSSGMISDVQTWLRCGGPAPVNIEAVGLAAEEEDADGGDN